MIAIVVAGVVCVVLRAVHLVFVVVATVVAVAAAMLISLVHEGVPVAAMVVRDEQSLPLAVAHAQAGRHIAAHCPVPQVLPRRSVAQSAHRHR